MQFLIVIVLLLDAVVPAMAQSPSLERRVRYQLVVHCHEATTKEMHDCRCYADGMLSAMSQEQKQSIFDNGLTLIPSALDLSTLKRCGQID